ncbi:MAG TPA: ATP-binding cassette domain-containing protein [Acidimicrobiales bacterium]|nr:ATP-binding cassette domain-containing protein [Acidimicrobiales bacterium]
MLQLIELTKRYGDVVALDGLSMTVAPGRIHGFVGRNGAGKTTTMRIALGLARPDAGEVRWADRPVTAADRRGFGYMPEERGLYPKMAARDQIVYFARLSGMGEAEATTAATRILDSIGLGERAGEPVERLSLGNQQRCQLAAALVTSPELLVLDEPFSGLDPVGVDALAAVLQDQVDRGTAVVYSSHQLDLVERLSDEVTIVDRGRVVASGPVAAVRRSRGADQLKVALEGGPPAWADSLPGVRVVGQIGDEVVLELLAGADDQAVLDAARQAGRVRSFRREAPTLTELFREVVSA